MTTYVDVFEMLEAVRSHQLNKGESLVTTSSVTGTRIGFATADTQGPATRWDISVADLKASCDARTSDEAAEIKRRMAFHADRREPVQDLRSGKLVLEERPHDAPEELPEEVPQEDPPAVVLPEADPEDFLAFLQG